MNRQEATLLYNKVNSLIDTYLDKWKVNPLKLKKYFKNGSSSYNNFLKRNNLENIEHIDKIIRDVLEDRSNIFLDKMKHNENNENITYEKILADYYKSSIGHINNIGGNKYKITDFGGEIICSIYSMDDLKKIRNQLINDIISNMNNDNIVYKFNSYNKEDSIDINQSIDNNKLITILRNKYQISAIVDIIKAKDGVKFKSDYKGYYIFQK